MDVFDAWDADQGTGSSPDTSPVRRRAGRRPSRSPQRDAASNIFSLRRVDWTTAGGKGAFRGATARSIRYMVVQNNIMVIATSEGTVLRWSLDGTLNPEPVQISARGEDIAKLFLDSTGSHLLVAMVNADMYYLHSRSVKPRKLPKWQGVVVESIAFDKFYGSEASTKSILVGNNRGQIFETVLEAAATKDRSLHLVCELDQPLPIRSLEFELLSSAADGEARILVLAVTSGPVRLYKFLGGPTFEALFARYKESGSINFLDFGGSPRFTAAQLHLFRESLSSRAESLALLTETGTYHGKLALSPAPSSADSVVVEAGLTDHFTSDPRDLPLSLAASQFHFLILYPHRLQAVSKLSGKQVQETAVDETQGALRAIMRDAAHGTFWLYSDHLVFQVMARDEDRNVWRLYLDKALQGDVRKFELAYKHCKDAQDRDQVDAAQADFYFKTGKYELSAKFYARTSASFEEVALKFVEDGQEGALRTFLLEKLSHMGEQAADKALFKTQRVMLCTWLTEIYLKRLSSLEGVPGSESEYSSLEDEFRAFLREHVEDLKIHPPTTYELLDSHGRRREILLYASLIEDIDRVVAFHIAEGNYGAALQELKAAAFERVEPLFYKYSYQLMEAEPARTVAVWTDKPGLNATKLIPALVRHVQRDKRPADLDMAVRYLKHCVADPRAHPAEPAVYSYLLQLYAQREDEQELLDFLVDVTEGREEFRFGGSPLDLKYALRICTQHAKTRACVHIYSCMELYEEAVELALRVDVGLAKQKADKPESEETRKRLWLMIARHLIEVQKVKVKEAMSLLEECPLLQIEDMLPFFPDFVVIDDFKDKICDSLLHYSETIKALKAEMEDYSQSTAEVERRIVELKARHLPVAHSQPCVLCGAPVMTQQFYIFPCRHAFHSDCLFKHVVPQLNAVQRRAVLDLREQLTAEVAGAAPGGPGGGGNRRKASQIEALQLEIDGYLAAECPLCGDVMIRSVGEALVTEQEAEQARDWDVN